VISDKELEEMEARCDAATVGPWEAYVDASVMSTGCPDPPVTVHIPLDTNPDDTCDCEMCHRDSRFIAAARSDEPALIAEVKRLRKNLRSVVTSVKDLFHYEHRRDAHGEDWAKEIIEERMSLAKFFNELNPPVCTPKE